MSEAEAHPLKRVGNDCLAAQGAGSAVLIV